MSASHSLFMRIFYFASLPYRLLNFSIRPLADITLFTSEERMAFGANVHAQFLFHTASFECIPTATNHGAFTVVRMDSLFHS